MGRQTCTLNVNNETCDLKGKNSKKSFWTRYEKIEDL